MRNLTIERRKTFVASAMKMKVYIEDTTSNELVIGGVNCRKLGDVKSGETKTFEVAENSAKVYVIADTLSRNYCNEFYQLPEGSEDIALSGKNYFNPFAGNPFRFDNNDNPEVLENRKQGKRAGATVIILICAVGGGLLFGLLVGVGYLYIQSL